MELYNGYYINESNNLIIFYPKDHFIENKTTFEVVQKGDWIQVHCSDEEIGLLQKALDFDLISEL